MRTTIDIPDSLMKKAKKQAIEEGITLKEFFTRTLEKELSVPDQLSKAPWESLRGAGASDQLLPEDSGFEGYSGPDWNHAIQVNESDDQ
ncbi:hypothetical protein [Rhodohalobacter sp. 8-1]|uniref:hypothetical protein n=1 Tax=Rhodohalobacter sp. 8-1 TaxID=3131972 RepID=UPI0030EBA2D5